MTPEAPDELIQIHGTLEEIVYRNENNAYSVIDVSSGDTLITAVGELPEMSPGEKLILTGRWTTHQSFGRQFKVERFERYLPDTAAQYLKYLSSGAISGIGPATARKIVDRFGENAFSVIENEPERLAVIPGITKDRAKRISADFRKQNAVRTVIIGLEQYGFTPSECIRIYKKLGANAAETVRENPYILCGLLETYSFERAETVAGKLGAPKDSLHRKRAGVTYILSRNLAGGHTALPREKVTALCAELLGAQLMEIEEAVGQMIEDRLLMAVQKTKREYLSLPKAYDAEAAIAERIDLLMKFSPIEKQAADHVIDRIEQEIGIRYDERQREAIKLAASGGVLILTGGPGTGKTTTVKGIIRFFEKQRLRVALAAPTGRAAKRMTELTDHSAKTIHRLLEVEWSETEEPAFKRNETDPLDADVIIIDETSMVDVFLFSELLKAIRFGSRLILVGDTDQLPAVGPGNVLGDLIDSGLVPVVSLTEIFRQARQSLIIMNAHRIIAGEMPELSRTDNDFFFMRRPSPAHAVQTVLELYASRLPKAYGYSPMTDIQVLCPSRKGECGTISLNRRLQDAINPPGDDKREYRSGGRLFREGDKVMQVRNNYDIPWEKGDESGAGLFNGDMGILLRIDAKAGVMTVDFDDGKLVTYPLTDVSDLETAYAVTVHKSQGSEYDAVILPLTDVHRNLSYRNLLYTAVTRAKKQIILVGDEDCVSRMVANDRQNRRYTLLKTMLKR